MSRTLILLGLILLAVGLLWRWIGVLRLGRLPGDIVVQHQNFTFYFPVATGLLISVVLTLILWLAAEPRAVPALIEDGPKDSRGSSLTAGLDTARRKQAMRRAQDPLPTVRCCEPIPSATTPVRGLIRFTAMLAS
jgi:hypothetical protein